MYPLSACNIIRIWEIGQNQNHLDKALAILSTGLPEMMWDHLTTLTIGQRDKYLLNLYDKTFGATLRGFAVCPKCAENLELTISRTDFRLLSEPGLSKKKKYFEFITENIKVKFRLPNSLDLAAVAEFDNMDTARRLVVAQCVLSATKKGKAIAIGKLPVEVISKLATHMAKCDPQMEILLDIQCPSCSHKWQMTFDIVAFLWKRISVYAKRLLKEVHTLAGFYKWREEDILAMNPIRRQYYLEMID